VDFLPSRSRAPLLTLAAPLVCGLAGMGAALAATWGMYHAGRTVPVELPVIAGEGTEAGAASTGHVITVLPDGRYLLGGSRLSREELARRLETLGRLPQAAGERVLIRADAGARADCVIELLELCRRGGLSAVRLEVREGVLP
jgi:biopolymer transport protein ExbD